MYVRYYMLRYFTYIIQYAVSSIRTSTCTVPGRVCTIEILCLIFYLPVQYAMYCILPILYQYCILPILYLSMSCITLYVATGYLRTAPVASSILASYSSRKLSLPRPCITFYLFWYLLGRLHVPVLVCSVVHWVSIVL